MNTVRVKNECIGKIKPMHAINNAPIDITFDGNFSLLSDASIPYARLHDTGGHYGSYVFVDIENIFRDFDADPKNPESYDFAFTDYIVNKLCKSGCMPFYRLGASIEINHKIRAYRIYPPRDCKKWAEICEGIINHYTNGFADGYFYPIEYWEIWNEPDNEPNPDDSPMWRGSMEEYFKLYSVAARYLKEKFPNIKIGGYGSCGFYKIADIECGREANISPRTEYFIEFFHKFLEYIKNEGAPLDFFSWHTYADPKTNMIFADYARKTLDSFGFEKTENICDEWNTGTGLGGNALDASRIAQCMIDWQNSSLDMAMYYDFQTISPYCNVVDAKTHAPTLAYYPFLAFGKLYKMKNQIYTESDGYVLSLGASDGENIALMLVNMSGEDREVEILLDGEIVGAQVFDEAHKENFNAELKENKLMLGGFAVAIVLGKWAI